MKKIIIILLICSFLFSVGTFDWQMFVSGMKDQIVSEVKQSVGSFISNTADQIALSAKSGWNSVTNTVKGWFTSDDTSDKISDAISVLNTDPEEESPEREEFRLTPIILLHGRDSNTANFFGVHTTITDHNFNDEYTTEYKSRYTSVSSQAIHIDYEATKESGKTKGQLDEDRLGHYLQETLGYEVNKNLFVFNYPNVGMVGENALLLADYIDDILTLASSGDAYWANPDFLLAPAEKQAYKNVKFILIGHSMGGLVSRYYIENLGGAARVEKLITICTPHYGSSLGDIADNTNLLFEPCDVDLQKNAKLYGDRGSSLINTGLSEKKKYGLAHQSKALNGNHNLDVKYYAIAGYDTTKDSLNELSNGKTFSVEFVINTRNKREFQSRINREISKHSLMKTGTDHELELEDTGGDNIVNYMSQLAVKFDTQSGKLIESQQIEKATLIITAGYSLIGHYHSGIAFEPLMHEAVGGYIKDGN